MTDNWKQFSWMFRHYPVRVVLLVVWVVALGIPTTVLEWLAWRADRFTNLFAGWVHDARKKWLGNSRAARWLFEPVRELDRKLHPPKKWPYRPRPKDAGSE